MKRPIPPSQASRVARTSAVLSLIILSAAIPLQARPPSPPEVVEHVKSRIGGLFSKIGRAIEKAGEDDEDEEYRASRRRIPPEERYYEPERRLPPRQVIPPPRDEDYPDSSTRRRDSEQNYTPDYQAERDRQYTESTPRRKPETGLRAPQKDVNRTPKTQESKPAQEPQPAKIDAVKPTPPPVVEEKALFATPVPNKSGFVYPPGMKQEASNMLDVRDMQPGQKVRDPRTGKVFLVP